MSEPLARLLCVVAGMGAGLVVAGGAVVLHPDGIVHRLVTDGVVCLLGVLIIALYAGGTGGKG